MNDLLEYETRFNLVPSHGDPVICVYDPAKFGADVVIDVIRTHPMIIIGDILQENPFFVPPDEFLQELQVARRKISQHLLNPPRAKKLARWTQARRPDIFGVASMI